MTEITPESPIATVFGRATKKRTAAQKIGLTTVGELLYRFPRRYADPRELSEDVRPEEGKTLTLVGEVADFKVSEFFNRRTRRTNQRVAVTIRTGGQWFIATYFFAYPGQDEKLRADLADGVRAIFTGRAKRFGDSWQLDRPHHVVLSGAGADQALAASMTGLVPIYPVTSGLDSFDLQRAIQFALTLVSGVPDILPPELQRRYDVLEVMHALRWVHGPDDYTQLGKAMKRFRFEEALVLQLVLARRRAELRARGAQARAGGGGLLAAFDERLPFELTAGQREVGDAIEADLAEPHPMHRLLQGEVGSGKTLVALRAMLRVVDSGGQAALLAPTEVLAQQHHRSISAMLGDLAGGGMLGGAADATGVALLTGSQGTRARRQTLLDIVSGEAGIVIGTHALLEGGVEFADLGLVVVDEQHRFGVEQRAALTDKADSPPHVLVMTATPIPRTVAMTVFGDLEVSTLSELPAGRAPIQTTVVPLAERPRWIERVWQRVREEAERGHQVYVVCPRIAVDETEQGEPDDPGDPLDSADPDAADPPKAASRAAAVSELAPGLAEGALAGLRIAELHGKLPPEEKDRTMRAFAAGAIDVLVATTVIEVGVDVPNATTMVLMDADRFGVSQLHQLRGRVGRGGLPGLCLLVTTAQEGSPARERLDAVAATTDGFELSRIDLKQRREGDVLGASQSGRFSHLQNLQVLRDRKTIERARTAAEELLAADPELAVAPLLAEAVADVEASRASEFLEKG
ncbi:MAG: ATP-dependent DNA helicase RecG [Gemmatimonadetes bacterium]|nr:ATP-dependent DNA helicase RecG [Gemmatimonadota bacterium]